MTTLEYRTQATGQPKLDLYAGSENLFFLKVVDAQIVFNRDADGHVDSLTLHQGGEHLGRRVE